MISDVGSGIKNIGINRCINASNGIAVEAVGEESINEPKA